VTFILKILIPYLLFLNKLSAFKNRFMFKKIVKIYFIEKYDLFSFFGPERLVFVNLFLI